MKQYIDGKELKDFRPVDFMIKACKQNWKPSTTENFESKNDHGFDERDYNFDELEKALLKQ